MTENNENDNKKFSLITMNETDEQNENNQQENFDGQTDSNQNDGNSKLKSNEDEKKDIFTEP